MTELTVRTGDDRLFVLDRVVCKDGTTLSVQASQFHYCIPKDNVGPYTHYEVGFPSVRPDWWDEYTGDGDVAGYVPEELISAFIAEHGGMA